MRWLRYAPEAWVLRPPQTARVAFLTAQPFAHRGLHSAACVENSRAAFRAAIARGHGIELDVQLGGDGQAYVFHDAEVDRLTARTGRLDALSAEALRTLRLAGTDETVPTLAEALALVGGRVPVLIEVKRPRAGRVALCLAVRRVLEGYGGRVAVMSFDPRIPGWFAAHAPRLVRGLVVTAPSGRARDRLARVGAAMVGRPHFLAHDVRHLPTPLSRASRALGLPVLTWTVRGPAAQAIADQHADGSIYEDGAC